jgi:aralkylamine N-acetyltransferase
MYAFASLAPQAWFCSTRHAALQRRRQCAGRRVLRAAHPVSMTRATPAGDDSTGVNVNDGKYASQRAVVSASPDVTPEEINTLLVKAGRPPRDVAKWRRAIDNSYVVVHARLVKTGALVGFARATSDRALNATVWDLVTDPMLRDRAVMARNVISYLLREIRRTVPTCSIALISDADDVKFFSSMDFVASPDGITSMVLSPDYSVEPNGP